MTIRRFALLALALATTLTACDTGANAPESLGPPEAPGAPDELGVVIWGTSNANRILNLPGDGSPPFGLTAFSAAYAEATGGGTVLFQDAAMSGIQLIQNDDPEGDYHPDSEGELYDWSWERTQEFLAAHPDLPTVILWNQGNDALRIMEGTATQEDYTAAQIALLDALARDFPEIPVYLLATTKHLSLDPDWEAFREAEIATCRAHPHCTVAADVSDEVFEAYLACNEDRACEELWYDDDLHWNVAAIELVMAAAARFIAEDLAS